MPQSQLASLKEVFTKAAELIEEHGYNPDIRSERIDTSNGYTIDAAVDTAIFGSYADTPDYAEMILVSVGLVEPPPLMVAAYTFMGDRFDELTGVSVTSAGKLTIEEVGKAEAFLDSLTGEKAVTLLRKWASEVQEAAEPELLPVVAETSKTPLEILQGARSLIFGNGYNMGVEREGQSFSIPAAFDYAAFGRVLTSDEFDDIGLHGTKRYPDAYSEAGGALKEVFRVTGSQQPENKADALLLLSSAIDLLSASQKAA